MDQLKERPALIEQFESILGIAAGAGEDAPIRTALRGHRPLELSDAK